MTITVVDSASRVPLIKGQLHFILNFEDLLMLHGLEEDMIYYHEVPDVKIFSVLVGYSNIWKKRLSVYTNRPELLRKCVNNYFFNRLSFQKVSIHVL